MKKIAIRSRNFVRRNRNTIAVGAVLGAVVLLQNGSIAALNQFLKDNDLFDAYYLPETEA